MARMNVKFVCGCGFKTDYSRGASEHADEHKHTLTIQGQVEPVTEKQTYASSLSEEEYRHEHGD